MLQLCTLGDVAQTLQFVAVLYLGSPLVQLYGTAIHSDLRLRYEDCTPILTARASHDVATQALIGTCETALHALEDVTASAAPAEKWAICIGVATAHIIASFTLSAFADVKIDSIAALAIYTVVSSVFLLIGVRQFHHLLIAALGAWKNTRALEAKAQQF